MSSSWYQCQQSFKTLGDMTFMAFCCHTLKGQGLGRVRKEVVTLKPEAIFVSRKRSIKDVIPEFSLFLILYHHGFLCCASSLGGSESMQVVKMMTSAG